MGCRAAIDGSAVVGGGWQLLLGGSEQDVAEAVRAALLQQADRLQRSR